MILLTSSFGILYKVSMAFISGGNELLSPLKVLKKLGVERGSTVADLGCGGAGHFIIPAAHLAGHDTIVYAVDILKDVLKNVASKARIEGINNVRTIWSDLEVPGATKIEDGSVDYALYANTLFQSKKHKPMLQEAFRLLDEGGRLMVIDWLKKDSGFGPPLDSRVDQQELMKIAKDVGFELVESFEPGDYHFGLIFEKP